MISKKISAIFVDIHGTILPKFNSILELKAIKDSYLNTAMPEFERLNEYCKNKGIKIVVVSGGSLIEVNELAHFFKLDAAAYYCEQGAICSLDKGKTWQVSEIVKPEIRQQYLEYIKELKNNFNVNVLDMSYRMVIEVYGDKEVHNKFKEFSLKNGIVTYILRYNENKSIKYMVIKSQINKYNAIKDYAQLYKIPEEEILFYGNGTNDIEAYAKGSHLKLVSTTPEFFFEVDDTYEPLIKNIQVAKDILVYGLTKYLI